MAGKPAVQRKPVAPRLVWLCVFEVACPDVRVRFPGKPHIRVERKSIRPGPELDAWLKQARLKNRPELRRALYDKMPTEHEPGGLHMPFETPRDQDAIKRALRELREKLRCEQFTIGGSQDLWHVYAIELTDAHIVQKPKGYRGLIYVGQTSLPVEERVKQHRRQRRTGAAEAKRERHHPEILSLKAATLKGSRSVPAAALRTFSPKDTVRKMGYDDGDLLARTRHPAEQETGGPLSRHRRVSPSPRSDSHTAMSPVLRFLDELFSRYRGCSEGSVAAYIPELAKVEPDKFGICVATIDGHVYEVGDSRHPFTIQSISKPFVYGLALDDHGPAAMARKVGVEPSGDAFNAISLHPDDGRPLNPMINAGAIATTGQIVAASPEERFTRILEMFGRHAGRALGFDTAVYESEARTGHRNRAIGHLLRNYDVLIDEPTATVDAYFRQCSILVTCHDLAVMAATLANRGVNPVTGDRALRAENVESVLSVMASCGMYDSSGGWIYDVGMPAKSGVGGGVLAVLPGQFGIGVFSPRLDKQGNSVRAVRVCTDLSRAWGLHQFNPPYCPQTSRRHSYACDERQSTRARCREEIECLRAHGSGIHVIEVQGVLSLATTEPVVREILGRRAGQSCLIVDFQHATGINAPAAAVVADLAGNLREDGVRILYTNTSGLPTLSEVLDERLGTAARMEILRYAALDHAMETCEDDLLRSVQSDGATEARGVEQNELVVGMTSLELAIFTSLLRTRRFAPGESIVHQGDAAHACFLVTRGVIAVHLGDGPGDRRVASFSAGTMVGGMAFIDGGPRSATLVAEGAVECAALEKADFEGLAVAHPQLYARLLRNVAVSLAMKLRLANEHLDLLSTRTR